MRHFIATTALFAASVTASASGYTDCATAALDGIDASKFNDCTDLSAEDCFCNNKDAIDTLSDSAADVCKEAGIDLSSLTSSLCSSDRAAAPARHASKPMEPVDMNMKRAYSPSSDVDAEMPAPRVVYVTETRTECSCKTTPAPAKISQIPVDVPVSSSMIGMLAASSPVYSNGILVAAPSSSVLFGSQASASAATPTPSGADPNRFSPFQGAAPQVSAARGGIAAMGVAAVMGLMIAL